jgi:transposase InsO family protein
LRQRANGKLLQDLEGERIYRVSYATLEQGRLDIVDWIERFYNRRRLYSSIDYRAPVAVENMLKTA